jgi:UDP-glucuronate 4-epimerase
MSKTLVTGVAGFIGFHVARRLLADGYEVVGIDNLNPYYDVHLKEDRLLCLRHEQNFEFLKLDIRDNDAIAALFAHYSVDHVVHLAAQAGVRHSIENPRVYIDTNVMGFLNILEACRRNHVKHLVYASSSSVYGANTDIPFSVHHSADHPVSLYAASKKANEMMAHAYSHLYRLPTTGLRFFTVYGPWGRPDMAVFLFTRAILASEPIDVFNYGNMLRDFTYIDDIVEGVVRVLAKTAEPDLNWAGDHPDPASSSAPYRIYNIGNSQPVRLDRFIDVLGGCLGMSVIKRRLPLQPGDVPETEADVQDLILDVGYSPSTAIEVGLQNFVDWYREYYSVPVDTNPDRVDRRVAHMSV